MKRFILILSFICSLTTITCQTWNQIFGEIEAGPPYDTDVSFFVEETSNGLAIIYGNADSIAGYWSQVFMKIDWEGVEEYRIEYEIPNESWLPGWWSSATKNSLGEFVQPGYTVYHQGVLGGEGVNPVLTKFSSEGDTLWRKVYPRVLWGGGDKVIECANGDFVISGRTEHDTIVGNPQVLLMRCDPQGELLWERAYGDTVDYGEYGNSIVEISNEGGFFISGNWYDPPNWDALLMKVDNDGNELWIEHYGHPEGSESAHVLGTSSDGNYYLAGSQTISGDQFYSYRKCRLRKFDVDGNTLWETLVAFNLSELNYFTAVKETQDGNVACAGIVSGAAPFYGRSGTLAKFDAQTGDSLWMRNYIYVDDNASNQEIFDFTPLSDGGYALTGHVWQSPNTPFVTDDVWVLKVDEYGCLEPGCEYTGLSELALDMEGSMTVFPNPISNGNLNININGNGKGVMPYADQKTLLSLYSMDGRLVMQEDIPAQGLSASFIYSLSLPNLSAGQYILHWSVGNTWLDSEQIVVE